MIIRLKSRNTSFPDLSEEQPYFVIGIEADDYRVLNDLGKPYLYPADIFEVVDPQQPADWVTEFGEDGERYAYPPELNQAGFFEDFFDEKHDQVAIFWHVVNRELAKVA